MTPVPASLTVNFTAQTIGTHRVCYRTETSGPYTCVTTECLSIGQCQAILPIYVDDQTCTPVTYYIYAQASCEDPTSNQGRVFTAVTFTPTPSCKAYTVTCALLDIDSITVTNPGSDYVTPPTVNIAGGGGNAVADALIGAGGILDLVITNTGAGYIDGAYTAVAILAYPGQPGSGATCSFIISGGKVQPVTIDNPGSGYINSGTVYLDTVSIGTPSIVAEFQVVSDYQTVIGFANINNFVPFQVVPSVILVGGGGTAATAEAVLSPCPALDLTGCSGDPITMPSDSLAQGEAVVVCDYTTPTVLPQFTVSQSGNCLCSCVTATIGVSGSNGSQVRYYYNKCNGAPATGVLTVAGSPSSIVDCIVPGSLIFVALTVGAAGTVSYGASCP